VVAARSRRGGDGTRDLERSEQRARCRDRGGCGAGDRERHDVARREQLRRLCDRAGAARTGPEVILGADGEPLADWEIELINSGQMPAPSHRLVIEGSIVGRAGRGTATATKETTTPPARMARAATAADAAAAAARAGRSDAPQPGEPFEPSRSVPAVARGERRSTGSQRPAHDRPGFDVTAIGRLRTRRELESVHGRRATSTCATRATGSPRPRFTSRARDDARTCPSASRGSTDLARAIASPGLSRPAGRNEKNPAMLEIHSVNGGDPEQARTGPRFEDLTALFPDERLKLETPTTPTT
jgi:hypothetical protein